MPNNWGTAPDQVWETMESLPDWNGRRNDVLGLSSYWAKRARDAEHRFETLNQDVDKARSILSEAMGDISVDWSDSAREYVARAAAALGAE